MKKKPANTFIVHGEDEAAAIVAKDLAGAGFGGVAIPERGESFEI